VRDRRNDPWADPCGDMRIDRIDEALCLVRDVRCSLREGMRSGTIRRLADQLDSAANLLEDEICDRA